MENVQRVAELAKEIRRAAMSTLTDMQEAPVKSLDAMDVDHFLLRASSDSDTFGSKLFYADMFRNASIADKIKSHYERRGSTIGKYTVIDIPCGKAPLFSFLGNFLVHGDVRPNVRWFCIDAHFPQLQFINDYYEQLVHLCDINLLKNNSGWVIPDDNFDVLLAMGGPDVFAFNFEELTTFFKQSYEKASAGAIGVIGMSIKHGTELTDSYTHVNEFTLEEIEQSIKESGWQLERKWGYRVRPESREDFGKMVGELNCADISQLLLTFPYQILCPMLAQRDTEFRYVSEAMFELVKRS